MARKATAAAPAASGIAVSPVKAGDPAVKPLTAKEKAALYDAQNAPVQRNRRVAVEEAPIARTSSASGRAVAVGRDGVELTRKRTQTSDIFHIPPEIIPQGWDYQWNVIEVIGQPQVSAQLAMAENGWRPVPAERHPGRFMAEGAKGSVIRDGLRLEERPMILTIEARQEEAAKAKKQVNDQKEQLRLSAGSKGASVEEKYRGVGPQISQTIAPAPDAPRPTLEIEA